MLGPQLFFAVHVYSIAACMHNAHYLLYADDLKLMQSITSHASQAALQADLHRFDQWAITWSMSVNKMKCLVLHLRDDN